MSYGNEYIEEDIEKLKKKGKSKTDIIKIISKRIHARYSDISINRGKTIATKLYEGKYTTVKDWAR